MPKIPKIPSKAWIYLNPVIKLFIIIVIGHILSKILIRIIKRAFARTKMDISLKNFTLKAISIICHILIVVSALSSIGISTSGIIASLSAVGLAVAVGLKDSLANVAGGILLLISPRFTTGDYIETADDSGTVIEVDLLHTIIKTPDNKQISIPNGILVNNHITNYSIEPVRRVEIFFPVPYECDVEKAKDIILSVIASHNMVLREPDEPMARVLSYEDSFVKIVSRCWCNTENYWTVFFDLTEKVRSELNKCGIDIPYNKLDVTITRSYSDKAL